jgi:hypothetical protein
LARSMRFARASSHDMSFKARDATKVEVGTYLNDRRPPKQFEHICQASKTTSAPQLEH